MNDFIIREVTMEELPACAETIRQSFGTVAEEFHLTQENCPTNPAFISDEQLLTEWEKNTLMIGLFCDEILAGFCALKQTSPTIFSLERVAVLPDFRHKGYGRALLQFMKNQAAAKGAEKLTIGIIEENTRLKNWYADLGFLSAGTKIFPHLPFTVGFMELFF